MIGNEVDFVELRSHMVDDLPEIKRPSSYVILCLDELKGILTNAMDPLADQKIKFQISNQKLSIVYTQCNKECSFVLYCKRAGTMNTKQEFVLCKDDIRVLLQIKNTKRTHCRLFKEESGPAIFWIGSGFIRTQVVVSQIGE